MATRPAYVHGTLGHARNPSTASDLSTSSNEDKHEETSRQILSKIFENIVSFPDYQPIPTRGLEYRIEVYVHAKRRHAGNICRLGGEEERCSPGVLVQEVAELLGQVMEQTAEVGMVKDQEAFVLSMHGTHLKLTAAHFTTDYLSHVRSPTMPESEKLLVRRSEPFDLKTVSGRAGALQLCIGILEYLRSGKAEIALLQKIFE